MTPGKPASPTALSSEAGPSAVSNEHAARSGETTVDFEATASTGEHGTATTAKFLGDYELIQKIAHGGMGVVYRARQISLNRIVALKMIRAGELAGDAEVRRFRIEAEAAARLDHPAIVPIYEVGQFDGQHFYSMGYVEGRSLSAVIHEGPLPPRHAAELLWMVADAMQYAHERGVIHRDLKPANILLSAECGVRSAESRMGSSSSLRSSHSSSLRTPHSALPTPKVTDFGLAKQTQMESDLTSSGQILGTPSYMPPEQARGEANIGPAADIYSLGAVLYAMLTGRPPFQAANAIETVRQVIDVEPVPPRRLNPGLDRDVETICLKCLQKSPSRRYLSAGELADDLQRYLRREPINARPVGSLERAWRWCRRKPAVAAAVAASALGLVALVAAALIGAQLRLSRQTSENRRLQAQAAEELAAQRQETADTQQYFALLNGARQRSAQRQPGWALAGIDDIKTAASLEVKVADPLELRSEAAAFLTGVDLRKLTSIEIEGIAGQPYASHLVAFHPNSKQIALSGLKHWFTQKVNVCEVPSGAVLHELTVASAPGWQLQHRVQDGIERLEFSPDGNTLAVITRSGWLHRWDLRKSPPPLVSSQLPAEVFDRNAFLDLTQQRVLFAHEPHGVRVWSYLSKGAPEMVFSTHSADWIGVGPGSRRIALTGSWLRILEGENFQKLHDLELSSDLARISPDGQMVAISMKDRIQLVDVESGQLLRALQDPAVGGSHVEEDNFGAVEGMDFSPDGTLLVSGGSDQTIKLWDVTSGTLVLSLFLGGADDVHPIFTPDGRYLATTGDRSVVLYEVHGAELSHRLAGQAMNVDQFELAQDVPLLVTSIGGLDRNNQELVGWDTQTGQALDRWTVSGHAPLSSLAIQDDGSRIALASRADRKITVWDVAPQDAVLRTNADGGVGPNLAGSPTMVRFGKNGRLLCCATFDDKLRAFSLPELDQQWEWSNEDFTQLLGKGGFLSLAVGQSQVLAGTSGNQIIRIVPGSADVPRMWKAAAGVTALALTADDSILYFGTARGDVSRLRLPDGNTLEDIGTHADAVTSVVLIEGDELLATASRDKTIQLWQQHGNEMARVLSLRASGPIERLRATSDGSRLIAHVQGEPALRVWRLDLLRSRLREMNLDW